VREREREKERERKRERERERDREILIYICIYSGLETGGTLPLEEVSTWACNPVSADEIKICRYTQ